VSNLRSSLILTINSKADLSPSILNLSLGIEAVLEAVFDTDGKT